MNTKRTVYIGTLIYTLLILFLLFAPVPIFSPVVHLAALLLPVIAAVALYTYAKDRSAADPKRSGSNGGTIAKVCGVLLLACLVLAFWSTDRTLYMARIPADGTEQLFRRSVIENAAMAATISAGILTIALSGLQKDMFWAVRGASLKIDERQQEQRRRIFERSYKLMAISFVIFAIYYAGVVRDALIILKNAGYIPGSDMDRMFGTTMPAHAALPLYCMGILMFAIPLLLATFDASDTSKRAVQPK